MKNPFKNDSKDKQPSLFGVPMMPLGTSSVFGTSLFGLANMPVPDWMPKFMNSKIEQDENKNDV